MDNPEKHLRVKIGQYALIINGDNKTLLLERERSKSWSLPGGRMDKEDKDWEQAFIREVEGETGLKLESFEPFDVKLIEDKWQVKYCVYFVSKITETEDEPNISKEHSYYKWVGKNDIQDLQIDDEPKVREVLEKYFSKYRKYCPGVD